MGEGFENVWRKMGEIREKVGEGGRRWKKGEEGGRRWEKVGEGGKKWEKLEDRFENVGRKVGEGGRRI